MTPLATIRNSDSSEHTLARLLARTREADNDHLPIAIPKTNFRQGAITGSGLRNRGTRWKEGRRGAGGERRIDRKEKQERESRLAIGKRRKRRFPPVLSDSRRWKRCLVAALHLPPSPPFLPLLAGLVVSSGINPFCGCWRPALVSPVPVNPEREREIKLLSPKDIEVKVCAWSQIRFYLLRGINAESKIYLRLGANYVCLVISVPDDCENVCKARIRWPPFSGKCR